jgi:uncharacterized protein
MQQHVTFDSDGVTLTGVIHTPDDLAEGDRRPAVICLHGFGGSKDGPTHIGEARLYESLGYVALRFDFRGCGDSGGARGHILCHDQVADTRNAISWLAEQPDVQPDAIAVSGQSFGGAVALYTAGVDERVAAVISVGGWSNGARKLRGQHPGPGEWDRFLAMLAEGRRLREEAGETLMVKRWDIVPVPEHLRPLLPPDRIMEFPVDTAQSIYDFVPDEVIGDIAPRPLLIYHGAHDSVTPTSEAFEIFRHAAGEAAVAVPHTSDRPNTVPELAILKGDHFPFAEPDPLLDGLIRDWLARNLPIDRRSLRGRTRRIVTGVNADGRSYFVEDGIAPHRYQSTHSPNVAQVMWATDEMPAIVDGTDPTTGERFFTAAPSPNGTILRIVDFPPDTEYDAEAMKEFLAAIVPESDHASATEAPSDRHFFFHTTHTLDYAIVLTGEIWAMVDDAETLMRQGDVLIQLATSHSWSNRSTADCKMAFVLIDGAPGRQPR